MKIFAFYLPQFHEIPQNDKWWGKGFTEWTNVKAAKPLFKGHKQPKHPLNNNYYNLLDKKTIIWQNELRKKYSIDGMIYYHYYFNGDMLLEKPAENLLKNKDIDMPFFFCWANHNWSKTWNGTNELLVKQVYGEKNEWEKHFQYLLPFFKDKRYEKKNNMPLFMIFTTDFKEKNEMFNYFDKRCKENGFAGIYLIETFGVKKGDFFSKHLNEFNQNKSTVTKRIFLREHNTSMEIYMQSHYIDNLLNRFVRHTSMVINHPIFGKVYSGEKLYRIMLTKEPYDKQYIHGAFFEWDNTPRHGYSGSVVNPPKKATFIKFMNKVKDNDYLFLNAWNEWAEGMVLEPTEENGYKYLEWINEWKNGYNSK